MSDTKYAFISAYLKGAESKIITSYHIDRIARTPDFQDILQAIKGTHIGDYLGEVAVDTFGELDEHLWRYFGQCVAHIEAFRFIPNDILKVLSAYLIKYDVYNLKAVLHQLSSGKSARIIPLGIIHRYGMLDELLSAETTDDIIAVLGNCRLADYIPVLKGYKIDEGLRSKLTTEAELDEIYYSNLLNTAKMLKDGFVLMKAYGLIIDLTNLQIVLRAVITGIGAEAAAGIIPNGYLLSNSEVKELLAVKLADLPGKLRNSAYREIVEDAANNYGRNYNLAAISETIETHKFTLVRGLLSPRSLTPLSVAWYLILKETEIRNLRLILKAIFDNRSIEEVKDYLVLSS